jgi:hypothetical protein
VSSDRIDPIEVTRPGPVSSVSAVLLTPVEREAARRRRERARDDRRRREAPAKAPSDAASAARIDLRV